jgi:hypothetical protein
MPRRAATGAATPDEINGESRRGAQPDPDELPMQKWTSWLRGFDVTAALAATTCFMVVI